MDLQEIQSLKKLSTISIVRSISFVGLVLVVFVFNLYPSDYESEIFIISVFAILYIILSVRYFQNQIQLWSNLPRYRFLSWYYISFSVIWLIVLLALTIVSYFLFNNIILSITVFVIFLVELLGIYLNYAKSLHFIAIKPNHIMIVKKQIKLITPENIKEIYYRNDILIFKLTNEKTIFVNFFEIESSDKLKLQIAKWLTQNHLLYTEIIDLLAYNSQR